MAARDVFRNISLLLAVMRFFDCSGYRNAYNGGGVILESPNEDVHAFFYLWYGEPKTDGRYLHWNHEVLPHWTKAVNDKYPDIGSVFEPPKSIHSTYYPLRGCYSSKNVETLTSQFTEMKHAGIGVVVVSWWGRPSMPGTSDTQGVNTDSAILMVLEAANLVEGGAMKVAFHLEPYPGRSAHTIRQDLRYITKKYGQSDSLLRWGERNLPLFYVYDSYHISLSEWEQLLLPAGTSSVRNTDIDGIFIGLWLEERHHTYLRVFDGFYTYFAATGFSYGSSLSNWQTMSKWAKKYNKIFIASVGPGYDDTKIRPWNTHNKRIRDNGRYYETMWRAAIEAEATIVSITSYNEWGEGTQIEPALDQLEMQNGGEGAAAGADGEMALYESYDDNPYQYLNQTLVLAREFRHDREREDAINNLVDVVKAGLGQSHITDEL